MSELDLSTVESQASDGVGSQMGDQLKTIFEGVSLEAAIAGMQDAFNGADLQVSGEQTNEAFGEIQKCMDAKKSEDAGDQAAEGEEFLAENSMRAGVQVTDSGLQYEIITAGAGAVPNASSTVRTQYAGTLIDGIEFDSSYKPGEPAEFLVGGVIAGWTKALQLMPVGSKWKLFIPYELAYGANGAGGAIGSYQALIFDIELVDIVS